MKKYLILFFISIQIINGQELLDQLKDDTCFCINQQTQTSFFDKEGSVLETCLRRKVYRYRPEFIKLMKEEGFIEESTKTRVGFEINLDHLNTFIIGQQEYFVNECEAYYLYSSALRIKYLLDIGHDKPNKKIKRLTRKINKSNVSGDLYFERGVQYLAIGNYNKAKKDFFDYLRNDPDHVNVTYFLAWAFELNKEYKMAIAWYEQLIKLNNHDEARLALEITKRKLKNRNDFYLSRVSYDDVFSLESQRTNADNKSSEKQSVPIIKGCEGQQNQADAKKCMSEVVKRYVNRHFDISWALEYSNLKAGKYMIQVSFKISKEGNVTDVKVLFDDPFIVSETKRVIKSLPPILKPGMLGGKPVDVYYSLPIGFLIRN